MVERGASVKGIVALLVEGIADDVAESVMDRMQAYVERRRAAREREAELRQAADKVAEASANGEGVLVQHDGLGNVSVTASPFVPRGTAYLMDMNVVPEMLRDGRR